MIDEEVKERQIPTLKGFSNWRGHTKNYQHSCQSMLGAQVGVVGAPEGGLPGRGGTSCHTMQGLWQCWAMTGALPMERMDHLWYASVEHLLRHRLWLLSWDFWLRQGLRICIYTKSQVIGTLLVHGPHSSKSRRAWLFGESQLVYHGWTQVGINLSQVPFFPQTSLSISLVYFFLRWATHTFKIMTLGIKMTNLNI